MIVRKNNSGCLIWILIILAIAGVAWVRYLIPIVVILIVIAVVNGKKNTTHSSQGEKRDRHEQSGEACGEATARSKKRESGGSEKEQKKQEFTGTGDTSCIITCDYCGCRVDTSKYNTCPHCGGPYWDNEQWKEVWRRKMM